MRYFGSPAEGADSVDAGIEIIDDALVEAVELRLLLVMEASVRAYGAEKAGGKPSANTRGH